jgi:acetyl esterase/lipase
MSLRLRLLNLGLRLVARPMMARAADPAASRRSFARVARLFRMPPYGLHLVAPGQPPLHWVSCRRRQTAPVILYFHGGAYVTGSPVTHLALITRIARLTGLPVVAPEYRLAPEHPAPAAYDDAMAAHDRLMAIGYAPGEVILAGDSAGGGLALAVLAGLCARGRRPAGLFAFSPWTDLALGSASLWDNAARDVFLPAERIEAAIGLVRGSLAAADPRLSPLHAGFDRPPPVLLQVGTTEILRDDSRRIAAVLRAAGGRVVLQEWRDCPHVWQILDGLLPEARAALIEVAAFVADLSSQPPPPADS